MVQVAEVDAQLQAGRRHDGGVRSQLEGLLGHRAGVLADRAVVDPGRHPGRLQGFGDALRLSPALGEDEPLLVVAEQLDLPGPARSDFLAWSDNHARVGQTLAQRLRLGPVPFTVDGDVAMRHPRAVFLQTRHPLLQFAVDAMTQRASSGGGAYRANVRMVGLSPGLWLVGLWTVEWHVPHDDAEIVSAAIHLLSNQVVVGDAAAELATALMAQPDELQVMQTRYLRCVLTAMNTSLLGRFDPQGQTPAACQSAIRGASPTVDRIWPTAKEEWDSFLRPEAVAAILWVHQLPQVDEGPYCLVDVGAATVHASFFRVHHTRDPGDVLVTKGGIALFGAVTDAAGMDCIGIRLVAAGAAQSHVEARGQEQKLLQQRALAAAVTPDLARMRKVWTKAGQQARQRTMCTGAHQHLKWLVVGGGSSVTAVCDQFSGCPPILEHSVQRTSKLAGSTQPPDLFHLPKAGIQRPTPYTTNPSFLTVAYGLAFPRDMTPEFTLPMEQRPVPPLGRRPPPTLDELGYG